MTDWVRTAESTLLGDELEHLGKAIERLATGKHLADVIVYLVVRASLKRQLKNHAHLTLGDKARILELMFWSPKNAMQRQIVDKSSYAGPAGHARLIHDIISRWN